MKKSFLVLALVGVVFAFFSSCAKDEKASPVKLDLTKTATIEGYAWAELNNSTIGTEFAPTGTQIVVQVRYADLMMDNGMAAPDGYWSTIVTVGSNGRYSVEVPATANGVNVEIHPSDFAYATRDWENKMYDYTNTYEAGWYEIGAVAGVKYQLDFGYHFGFGK